jgi:hypothetical protein
LFIVEFCVISGIPEDDHTANSFCSSSECDSDAGADANVAVHDDDDTDSMFDTLSTTATEIYDSDNLLFDSYCTRGGRRTIRCLVIGLRMRPLHAPIGRQITWHIMSVNEHQT